MDKEAFFWKIMAGELSPPNCALTLGCSYKAADAEAGTVEVEFQGKPEFTNPTGHIYGGFLSAMLDESMSSAIAAMLNRGEFPATLNMNVSFEKPAKVGPIQAKARVIKRGKEVAFLAGELYQNSELIATGTATALIRAMPV